VTQDGPDLDGRSLLVVGGAGFVGSNLVRRALDGGARPARDHPSDTHRPRLRVNISRSDPARFALCY